MRAPIPIIADLRERLEWDGIKLEAAFTETDEPRVTVFVSRVEMPPTSLAVAPMPVVKFSEREHAIPHAAHLKLATPSHYRENYENVDGIHDEREATYLKDMSESIAASLQSSLGTPIDASSLNAEATYAADGYWLFCTSVKPPSAGELEHMRSRFAAESVRDCQKVCVTGRDGVHRMWSAIRSP